MQWRRRGRGSAWFLDTMLLLISTGLVSACCRSCPRCIRSEDDHCPPCDADDGRLKLSAEQKEAINDPAVQAMLYSLRNDTQRLTRMQHQKQLIDVTEQSQTITELFRPLFRSQAELSPIPTESLSPVFSEPLEGVVQLCRSRVMYSAPLVGLDRNSDIIQVFQFLGSEKRQWILGEYCEDEGTLDASGSSAVSCETSLCAHYAPVVGVNIQRVAVGVWWIWTPCCLPHDVTQL